MYKIQNCPKHYYTISNVNYHKPESIKTQVDDRVVSSIIVSDKVTAKRGALSFRKQVHALSFRKQVHALIIEHKIISKHPQNMRFSLLSACTFMHGDTVVCSPKEFMNILRSLDVTKATSLDKMSNIILKHCASTLCHPTVSVTFYLCFFFIRNVPIKWKETHV